MLLTDFTVFIAILLLVGVSGFFSASEIGLMGVSRYRAQQWAVSPTPGGRALGWLLRHPAAMLATILFAITATNYIAETIAASWVIENLGVKYLWLAIVGVAVLIILFAEIVPILYASANADRVARFVALPVRFASIVLSVPAWIISRVGTLLGGEEWSRVGFVSVEELRSIVSVEAEHAELEEEEKQMLHSIFEFADMVVKDVMVPRAKIVAIPAEASVLEAARVAGPTRVSRLPVYRGDLDNILGLVSVKDLLLPLNEGKNDLPVKALLRPFLSVAENKQVSELLEELRRRKQLMAIVRDREGRTVGLLTVEDLLEEIVGDIFDEYDLATPAVEKRGRQIIVDGRMSIAEVSRILGAPLPEGRYATVAGLFLNRLGAIPREGEETEIDGFKFRATRMDGDRIARISIALSEAPGEGAAPQEDS